MARAFKFFAAFFLTALVIFGSILALSWKPFNIFFENRDAMVEGSHWVEETYSLRGLSRYIESNPEHVSIVSTVLSSPDSTISFEGGTPRPMGTTANFLILAAAANLIHSGELDGEQMIEWGSVSVYQIPGVNGSEHNQSYRAASNRGWIDDNNKLTLFNALKLLAEFNDLALADYLWWLIGPDRWPQLSGHLHLEYTGLPLPFSGLYLTISPGIREMSASEIYQQELGRENSEFRESVIDYSRQFADQTEFRKIVLEYSDRNRLGNTFMEERDGLALFPKTTANEFVRLLTDLINDELINERVSHQVKEWMRWPMERQSGIQRDFTDYGAIYDHRMGLLNGIDFGTSVYTGNTTVQAVFFDRIQIAFWFHMSSNHMHQDFQQRLIFDPAMIDQMKRVVGRQIPESSALLDN